MTCAAASCAPTVTSVAGGYPSGMLLSEPGNATRVQVPETGSVTTPRMRSIATGSTTTRIGARSLPAGGWKATRSLIGWSGGVNQAGWVWAASAQKRMVTVTSSPAVGCSGSSSMLK